MYSKTRGHHCWWLNKNGKALANFDNESDVDAIVELQQELLQTQIVVTEIQDLQSGVSCFVENLDFNTLGRSAAFDSTLEIGSKIRNLDLPEFTIK